MRCAPSLLRPAALALVAAVAVTTRVPGARAQTGTAPTSPAASSTSTPTPAEPERRVTLSRRGVGPAHRPNHAASVVVNLDTVPSETRTVLDHTGKTLTVQGVSLQTLIDKAPKDSVVDAARLRFRNGTEVVVPFDRLPMLDVFVARRLKHSDQAPFTTDFDNVPLGQGSWRSPRSLVFTGNRVFVAAPAEPPRGRGFSPWGFLDSLVEVELIHDASWQQVFQVSDETSTGRDVWRARCQTCHGVRGAGASFGWDFVNPLPLSTWRTPDGLYTHVRAHKIEAAQLGLAMPPQPDVSRDETDALHAWMTVLAKKPLAPYTPPTTTPSSKP